MQRGDTVWVRQIRPPLPIRPDILGMVVDIRPDWYGGSGLIGIGRPTSSRNTIGYQHFPRRPDVLVLTTEDGNPCLSWYDGAHVIPVQSDG